MADPFRSPDTGDDIGTRADGASPPRAPRWVKVVALVALVVMLLLAVALLTGGGGHGPAQHATTGDAGSQVSPGIALSLG